LHETTISLKNEELQTNYLYTKQQFSCTMEKINYNRIKAVLAEKNVSSKELAKHLDKTESTVSRWCTNDVQPSVEVFYQIAKFLEVDIRELFVSTAN
jgi:putative transcriptional regulator